MYLDTKHTSIDKAIATIALAKPLIWLNSDKEKNFESDIASISNNQVLEAMEVWNRFAPFFKKAFPETLATDGIIESPLLEISNMKQRLEEKQAFDGNLFLKCDNALPVAGSIKARGGFFEVLTYAERLALQNGLLNENDNYECFASPEFRKFFSQYIIGVASTGNLGLSIGIMASKLGFKAKVYMSEDAKEWKKQLLRENGAEVIEFPDDFSITIKKAREEVGAQENAYFVDDEDSEKLFLGYATGAYRLAEQLKQKNIKVDKDHPLFMHLPCGVGGSPGGKEFGLKQIYGDNVHYFFVEPTNSPSVLVGLVSGEMNNICVQDIGLDGKTEADGLAVGRASKFATQISKKTISGIYTIEDDELYSLLASLKDTEDLFLEPSSTSGLKSPEMLMQSDYIKKNNINMKNAIHIAWSTGGDLVPEAERKLFYNRGKTWV